VKAIDEILTTAIDTGNKTAVIHADFRLTLACSKDTVAPTQPFRYLGDFAAACNGTEKLPLLQSIHDGI